MKRTNKKEEYDTIADEIFRLRELKKQAAVDTLTRYDQISRITELHDFINEQPTEVTEFDEKLVKRLIQKITVFEGYIAVEFKSVVSVEIEG